MANGKWRITKYILHQTARVVNVVDVLVVVLVTVSL